jgi:hypothetical protein
VGVGRPGATAYSALLNFIVRDGCGMLASLLFTSVASSKFKTNVKKWRLFADIMVDVGITLEVAAVQMPQPFFLPMISVGTMCRAVCGVAAGACGGAINLHWAKGGSDITDINSKFGAQNTVTGSLGLVAAALFAKSLATVDLTHLWILYSALTVLHIFANMRCMRLLSFDTFNTVRLELVAEKFFAKHLCVDGTQPDTKPLAVAKMPSPRMIAKTEPLLFLPRLFRRKIPRIPIYFGVSFQEFSGQSDLSNNELQILASSQRPYLIAAGVRDGHPVILVALTEAATGGRFETKAYFHALLLGKKLERADPSERRQIEAETEEQLERLWPKFCMECEDSGWDITQNTLQSRGYEFAVES